MNNWAVKVKNLTVAYDQEPVLWDIELKVSKEELMCIVGPNGAGKSTLIKAILNIVKPISGQILFNGKPYQEQKKLIGYVPQRESVDWDFPTNVLDIVIMGRYGQLGWFTRPSKKDKSLAINALEKVGMKSFANRQISQLSGGQQQRVFLARALVQDAEIYFMDEPFQGVDAKTEKAIIKILQQFRSEGKTVIIVHHDLQTVADYFDSVTLLNKKVIASGPIEKVFTEANLSATYKGNVKNFHQMTVAD